MATAIALVTQHNIDLPWCFNRKEAKDHGEGGSLVGAPLCGKVLVVDDVITAGTAIREAVSIIEAAGARFAAVAIAFDRQERGSGELSAIQEVEQCYQAQVVNIVSLNDLVEFVRVDDGFAGQLSSLERYYQIYGVHR